MRSWTAWKGREKTKLHPKELYKLYNFYKEEVVFTYPCIKFFIFILSTSPHWVLCQPRTLMLQCKREFLQRLRGLLAICSAHGVQDAEPHRLMNEFVKGFQSSGLGVFPHVWLCLNSCKFSLLCDLFSITSIGRTIITAPSSVCWGHITTYAAIEIISSKFFTWKGYRPIAAGLG